MFSLIASLLSFARFMRDSTKYYSFLKNDIIKSANYTDFKYIRQHR
jgi:hypothetical protein